MFMSSSSKRHQRRAYFARLRVALVPGDRLLSTATEELPIKALIRSNIDLGLRRCALPLAVCLTLGGLATGACSEGVTILLLGDQESWLGSTQVNLRDDGSETITLYGRSDRLATALANAESAATASVRAVLKLNAGDSFLTGPRLSASERCQCGTDQRCNAVQLRDRVSFLGA